MRSSTTTFATVWLAITVAASIPSCSSQTGGHATNAPASAPSSPTAPSPAPSAAAPTPTPPSDDEQIRQTVTAFQDAYNTQNWTAYTELMCAAMRAKFTGPVMDYVKKGRAESGLTHITITAVTINGETATAAMNSSNEALGTRAVSLPLKLEDGWKICQT